jgi:hypothetical protein
VGVPHEQSLPKKPSLTHPDHLRKFYGVDLAEVFRTPLYDCSIKNVSGVPDFVLTRLKGGPMERQRAPAYPEDRAILICVALAPTTATGAMPQEREFARCFTSKRQKEMP